MTWLVSDWDHRDPQDDLHDIDCGHYLTALAELPSNIRQLLEDADHRVEVREMRDEGSAQGKWRVVHIVKKREPEFIQGTDNYFVYDKFGARISLTEEQYDSLLGINHNPDDIMDGAHEFELISLDSEQSAPRDIWDVVWSATNYISSAKSLINRDGFAKKSIKQQYTELEQLAHGEHPDNQDAGIYSAKWFYYSVDKRIKSAIGISIATKVKSGITRSELMRLMGPNVTDRRPTIIMELKAKALKMPLGKRRAATFRKIEAMKESVRETKKKTTSPTLPKSDRNKLWELWKHHELMAGRPVQLTNWQFEKMYTAKLQSRVAKGEIQSSQVAELLARTMADLYPEYQIKHNPVIHKEISADNNPAWLENAEPMPIETDHVQFDETQAGWLPESVCTRPEPNEVLEEVELTNYEEI